MLRNCQTALVAERCESYSCALTLAAWAAPRERPGASHQGSCLCLILDCQSSVARSLLPTLDGFGAVFHQRAKSGVT